MTPPFSGGGGGKKKVKKIKEKKIKLETPTINFW
jgi:hypothetical protein